MYSYTLTAYTYVFRVVKLHLPVEFKDCLDWELNVTKVQM